MTYDRQSLYSLSLSTQKKKEKEHKRFLGETDRQNGVANSPSPFKDPTDTTK